MAKSPPPRSPALPSLLSSGPAIGPSPKPSLKPKASTGKPKKRTVSLEDSQTDSHRVAKPKQCKSRNGQSRKLPSSSSYGFQASAPPDIGTGCHTCKRKRLKCDETKPGCNNCRNKGRNCEGYKKDFEFRAYDAASSTTKPVPSELPSSDDLLPWPRHEGPQAASPDPPISTLLGSLSRDGLLNSLSAPPSPNHCLLPREFGTSYHQPESGRRLCRLPVEDQGTSPHDEAIGLSPSFPALLPGDIRPGSSPGALVTRTRQSVLPESTHHPAREMEYAFGEDVMMNHWSPSQALLPGDPDANLPLHFAEPQQYEAVEEMSRRPEANRDALVATFSPNRFQSSSPFPVQHLRLSSTSHEMLVMRFDQQTCGILSVVDGRFENPWRTIIWPLAQDAPALAHALFAMTAFHASKDRQEMGKEGIVHLDKSIKHLLKSWNTSSMSLEAKLATTLALAFSESWDHHILTGTQHLKAAKHLIRQIQERDQGRLLTERETERLKFLSSTWIYMDVIARLTSVDDDKSTDFAVALDNLIGPCQARHKVDPLMGCASTLFPLVGKVANLVRQVSGMQTNDACVISHAEALKRALEEWTPPPCFEVPEDQTSDIRHSLDTAEAYRWATLLYLHQAVPEMRSKSSHELAMTALRYLLGVPMASRAVIVQIYPLLAAGCEATSMEDRSWIKRRWEDMMQRMLIGNLDKCLEVTKLVWDRRGDDESAKARLEMEAASSRRSSGDRPYEDFTRPLRWSNNGGSIDHDEHFPRTRPGHFDDDDDGRTAQAPDTAAFVAHGDLPTETREELDYERTVRGRLHWRGVMKDRGWEILLG